MKRLFLALLLVCVAGLGSTAFAQDLSSLTLPIAAMSESASMVFFAAGLIVLASQLRRYPGL